ncbi:MAG: YicC family protein [Planctomycetota bacterium]|nr:MAG: YicC family protein [Planctomycetota bacterium]
MINSMTGYGEAQGEINGATYTVEIKTVNNRYLKTSIRLPEAVSFLEEDIDKLLRKNLSRGTVNYVLLLKNAPANALFDINETAIEAITARLNKIVRSSDTKCEIDIASLLTLPGMLTPTSPDEEKAEQIKKAVLDISQKAIGQLKEMRATEGAALSADLKSHCKAIKQELEQIHSRSSVVGHEYQDKLKKRVDELLADARLQLDTDTLAREVAVFADRSDISEETARLDSHIQQFTTICQGTASGNKPEDGSPPTNIAAGRRLDFISQEMLREANTIASKASDVEIIRRVIDIKCWIDRIKEQVQNVE